MAITFVNQSVSADSSTTVNVPSGVQDGDLLIAYILAGTNTDTISSAPSGWTSLDLNASGASPGRMAVYYRVASSEPASYSWTWTSSTTFTRAVMVAYRGVDPSSPIHAHAIQNNSGSTTKNCPSITTSVTDCMLVAFAADGNLNATSSQGWAAGTFPSPAVATLETAWINHSPGDFEDGVWSSSGATGTMTMTTSSSFATIASSIALAPITTVSSSDTGTGADGGETIVVSFSSADTGTGTEAEAVLVAFSDADTGAGVDAAALAVLISDADTGSGGDAVAPITALVSDAESGVGVEAVVALIASLLRSGRFPQATARALRPGAAASARRPRTSAAGPWE